MSEVIRGLCVTISGQEIVERAHRRLEDAEERLEKLREALTRVDEMDPRDRELAGLKTRGGDMKDEVEQKIRQQESAIEFYEFLSEHVETDSSYRIDISQLKIFGIESPYRY